VPLRDARTGAATVLLRPEELHLRAVSGGGFAVELVEFYGHDTMYLIRVDRGLVLRVRAGSAPRFGRGDRVEVAYAGPPAVAYPNGPAPPEAEADAGTGVGAMAATA
jgi:hypothetical protein